MRTEAAWTCIEIRLIDKSIYGNIWDNKTKNSRVNIGGKKDENASCMYSCYGFRKITFFL